MGIKSIVTNIDKLALVSSPVVDFPEALLIVDDVLDTAKYHAVRGVGCIGLACNQIGILKRIIVVHHAGKWIVMINPEITDKYAGRTSAKEMCLSRPGIRTFLKRFKKVKVTYLDEDLNHQNITLSRLSARVVQHEVDHLDGKFI
jgi:peptide deformylase